MQRLTEKILAHADGLPEGTPLAAKCLLHLGKRSVVDKALSRLVERGQLTRAYRGVYLRPITCRFGTYIPAAEDVVKALSNQHGEMIVSSPAATANFLGLTDQVPMRSVFITSGRSRTMTLGKQVVQIRHAPRWQLTLAHKPTGELIRALAWAGPKNVDATLNKLKRIIPETDIKELVTVAPQLPNWLARSVSKAVHG